MDIFQKCYDYFDSKMVRNAGLYPFFRPIEESEGATVVCGGKKVIMIGSNNYLGLTHDPRVKEAAVEAIRRFGTGCTGSRFLNGNFILHDELEHKLASFVGKPAALVFSTGFLTNLGAISCLGNPDDLILSDADNHASIIAGCKMAKANIVKYSHNDCQDLAKKLQGGMNGSGALIVTDGVFSMTGAIVDLPGIVKIKKDKPGVRIYIDDAHSFGVLGENGRGTANHFGLTDEVDLVMGTFSKSFASIGGFIASDSDVIEFVRHKATSLIFSAAIPPASAATVLKCIELMEKEPEHLERLHKNTRKMREGFESIGINFVPSETPIISIRVGEEIKTFKLIKELFERGLFACPVVYPAVPYGQSMIRTSYMSTHTDDELEFVLDVFKEIAPKYGLFKKDGESLPSKANGYKLEF